MRVLVTGHRGYIGSVLVPLFQAAGHEVVGLDTDLYRGCTFGDPQPIPAVPQIDADLRDVTVEQLDGIDAIVHLAALSNDPLGDLDSTLTYDINHLASVRLARLGRDAGRPAGSCSRRRAATTAPPAARCSTRRSPLRPGDALRRVQGPRRTRHRAARQPVYTVVSLRNATAYGVSPRLRCDVVLNNLVAWAHTTGAVRLKSDGTPWRPIVHIRDIARAFLLALDAPREVVGGKAFNVVSTQENYQIRDLAAIVAERRPRLRGGDRLRTRRPTSANYRVNGDRFAEALGFEAEWDARRGAAELAAAFRDVGLTLDEVEGPRFQRIARIRERLADGSLGRDLRVPAGRRRVAPMAAS